MKKTIMIIIMLTFSIMITACSNDDANSDAEVSALDNKEQLEDTTTSTSSGESDEAIVEDQLDLGVGDTGTFDNLLGKYEITLVSAKLLSEIDGEESELDMFIYLDIIIKNVSQEVLSVDDLMFDMEVTDDLKGSGFSDGSDYFTSLEKMTGNLEPGEEITGQFVTYVYDENEYYFRKNPASITRGSANHVIWTIKADEAK